MKHQHNTPIALVTGASAGFGAAICRVFAGAGWRVIGAARRADKLQTLRDEIDAAFLPLPLDVSDKAAVAAAVGSLPADWKNIEVLVNNACLALGLERADAASLDDWERMVATNINGLLYMTPTLLPKMLHRGSGTIINIGSIAGNWPYFGGNVYGATKAFVEQFSLNLRADLAGTPIRVSVIEPGLCSGTEFSAVRFHGDEKRADAVYEGVQAVTPDDIARTVLWIAQQPAHVNINRIEIMPVAQSFAGLSVAREKNRA